MRPTIQTPKQIVAGHRTNPGTLISLPDTFYGRSWCHDRTSGTAGSTENKQMTLVGHFVGDASRGHGYLDVI
jgi:hypothetical protein